MLHKCANSECLNLFRSLYAGKLFKVESGLRPIAFSRTSVLRRRTEAPAKTRHYWLCDVCTPVMTLTFSVSEGMIAVPLTGTQSGIDSGLGAAHDVFPIPILASNEPAIAMGAPQ